jgi:hypothetical protein
LARLLRFLRLEPRREPRAVDPEIERLRLERQQRFASGMEIAEEAPDAQPFLRCGICEADNSKFAAKCTNCGAPLTTPEQRAFNDALWEKRRASEQAARVPESAVHTRALGEEIARTVADRERDRMSWMPGSPDATPGMRILAALPPPLRTAAILGGLAEMAGTGIAAFSTHDAGWRFVFFASVAVVGAIFVPRRRWR